MEVWSPSRARRINPEKSGPITHSLRSCLGLRIFLDMLQIRQFSCVSREMTHNFLVLQHAVDCTVKC